MMKHLLVLGTLGILLFACSQPQESPQTNKVPAAAAEYVETVNQWHHEREESLQKENSWLALAGLYWLEPGRNSFGSSGANDIVFPEGKIAPNAGAFILQGNEVWLEATPEASVLVNGQPPEGKALVFRPDMEAPQTMQHGALSWVVISRGDKYGIRLWDAEHPARQAFKGIARFPVTPSWKVEARLEQNALPKQIAITNVLGQTSQEPSPGAVVFTINGKQHRLDALEEGEELFIIFADKTNGNETYGAGRYLYIPKPGADGKTVIDFNKAYNPPCAFTGYATCPLPPKQNFLPLAIPAGEKSYALAQ
ncbi:DUF1684 domain-containing protein [Pontibacter sp. CAU 1760]